MWSAAAITCFTAPGAPAGATARPSNRLAPQVALVRWPLGGSEVQPAPQGTAAPAPAGAAAAASAIVAPTAARASFSLISRKAPARLVARWVTRDEAGAAGHVGVPAGAGAAGVPGGIPAQAGDHRERVAGVGVDRDPASWPGAAPALHRPRGQRAVDQFTTVQGEADRAGAVIAAVPPAPVAAAPYVGLGADPVRRRDHALDRPGRVDRGDRATAGERRGTDRAGWLGRSRRRRGRRRTGFG